MVKNVDNKPKITGLGFNVFAVITLLVLLPLATAVITSLANTTVGEYESVNRNVEPDEGCDYGPAGQNLLSWTDKGANVTDQYLNMYPSTSVTDYETMYNESSPVLGNLNVRSCAYLDSRFARNNDVFFYAHDNHNSLRQSNINGYEGYLGYSGDEFGFKVHEEYFKYIPEGQDVSKLKFTFIDHNNAFACDYPMWQELRYKSDITFIYDNLPNSAFTIQNFEFTELNKYEVVFLPEGQTTLYANGTAQPDGNVCHVQFVLEYEFSPFESMEFYERFNREYDKISMNIRVYDIRAEYSSASLQTGGNQYNGPSPAPVGDNGLSYPLAFEGDWFHGVLFEYASVDTSRTNFWLNGGTLIMGVGLFALAIANTPYWNPVVNFFKPEGK